MDTRILAEQKVLAMATSNDLTKQGIAALKAGDKQRAAAFLKQAIQADKNNQVAWLWLSGCVDGNDDKRQCLERVVAIDATNEAGQKAAKGLAQIRDTELSTGQEEQPPQPSQPPQTPQPLQPSQSPQPSQFTQEQTAPPSATKTTPKILVPIILVSLLLLLIIGAIAGFVLLNASSDRLISNIEPLIVQQPGDLPSEWEPGQFRVEENTHSVRVVQDIEAPLKPGLMKIAIEIFDKADQAEEFYQSITQSKQSEAEEYVYLQDFYLEDKSMLWGTMDFSLDSSLSLTSMEGLHIKRCRGVVTLIQATGDDFVEGATERNLHTFYVYSEKLMARIDPFLCE